MNFTRLRILELDGTEAFDTGGDELIVLPLAGSCRVTIDGETFELEGRESVFARGHRLRVRAARARASRSPGRAGSRCPPRPRQRRLEPRYGPAEDVPVELRGAGNACRQVNNFCIAWRRSSATR